VHTLTTTVLWRRRAAAVRPLASRCAARTSWAGGITRARRAPTASRRSFAPAPARPAAPSRSFPTPRSARLRSVATTASRAGTAPRARSSPPTLAASANRRACARRHRLCAVHQCRHDGISVRQLVVATLTKCQLGDAAPASLGAVCFVNAEAGRVPDELGLLADWRLQEDSRSDVRWWQRVLEHVLPAGRVLQCGVVRRHRRRWRRVPSLRSQRLGRHVHG
jgi:hypothetical protein